MATEYEACQVPADSKKLTDAQRVFFSSHGLELRIRNPEPRSVVVEFRGDVSSVHSVELIGDSRANETAQRSTSAKSAWVQFNSVAPIPDDSMIRIRIVTQSRTVSVPMEFHDTPIPQPIN